MKKQRDLDNVSKSKSNVKKMIPVVTSFSVVFHRFSGRTLLTLKRG